jgi:hypothetical protein
VEYLRLKRATSWPGLLARASVLMSRHQVVVARDANPSAAVVTSLNCSTGSRQHHRRAAIFAQQIGIPPAKLGQANGRNAVAE